MAYIFRIHKGPEAGGNGWQPKGEIISGKEGVGISSIMDYMDHLPISGKVGTSIPTPLARIYLFRTAFLAKESTNFGVYGELISDCLDLLQFLFEKGEDPKLKAYVWEASASIAELKRAGYPELSLLGDSLKMALDSDSQTFSQNSLILYLLEYDGVLLGGTSPFSIVFTSPNLRRIIRERRAEGKALDFSSNKRVEFFNKPVQLKDRPIEFKEYLLSMTKRYNREFIAGDALKPFTDYIERQTNDLRDVSADIFAERYRQIICKNAVDSSKSLPIHTPAGTYVCYNSVIPEMKDSHFIIRPTVEVYKRFLKNTPLALPSSFSDTGWTYIDEPWDVRTEILDRCCKGNIADRKLPKNGSTNAELTNMQYPWISNCDIFTERLIDLTYDVNTEKFFNNANTPRFLIPIKKEYFWFFTVEDLKKNLHITVDSDQQPGTSNARLRSVKVELDIPLNSAKGYIRFSRTYTDNSNDPYTIKTRRRGFGLGIFPFYRINEEETGLKNQYSVYMFDSGDRANAINLSFYTTKRPNEPLTNTNALRSQTPAGLSKVYNLRTTTASNSFDFIEMEIADENNNVDTGLVIPLWPDQQTLDIEAYSTIFSIDFGTSNTHIAYLDPKEGKVKPFEISAKEQQMVLLNAPYTKDNVTDFRRRESFGRASDFTDFLREFVPSVIGPDSHFKKISYPVKTASLESNRFSNGTPALFENINIGYDIDSEQVQVSLQNFIYQTNLKWALQYDRSNIQAKGRVEAYCEQTLWMMKNLIVLKGFYCKNIKILYFYPESMLNADRQMFNNAWKNAKEKIFDQCGFHVELLPAELESVAPYYSLLKRDEALYAYNSANIDIGGGTTDVFLFDKKYKDGGSNYFGYESSVQFAGNDIWSKTYPSGDKNGFVEYMKYEIARPNNGISPDLLEAYKNFGRKDNPEDMSSFFFKHSGYTFGERIGNNGKLKYVLLLHYAAILWYLTDMIKYIRKTRNPELDLPSRVTFTGKGSEYLKIITPDEDMISKITFALLLAFGFSKEEFKDGFKVSYPENPKGLTAEGGVYKLTADRAIRVNFVPEAEWELAGIGSNVYDRDTTKYTNIGKKLFGFEANENEACLIRNIKKYKEKVMKNFENFISGIFDNKILQALLKQLNIVLTEEDRQKTMEFATRSFDIQSERYIREYSSQGEMLEGSIFFLALKNTLIDLSNYYSNQITNNN